MIQLKLFFFLFKLALALDLCSFCMNFDTFILILYKMLLECC